MAESDGNDETSPFLKGNKIYLRGVVPDDADSDYIKWMNDSNITQFLETGYFPSSASDLEDYISDIADNDDVLFLAIIDIQSEKHIGNIKLGPINWIHRRGDIGILVGEEDFWGQGIATEAIRLITSHAFNNLNLHKLTAGCYEENKGSKKAFEKVGFKEEGRREKHAHYDGSYTDSVYLGLLRKDFDDEGSR
jgi:RimJ/RimL family protein N-acetyltransferase